MNEYIFKVVPVWRGSGVDPTRGKTSEDAVLEGTFNKAVAKIKKSHPDNQQFSYEFNLIAVVPLT